MSPGPRLNLFQAIPAGSCGTPFPSTCRNTLTFGMAKARLGPACKQVPLFMRDLQVRAVTTCDRDLIIVTDDGCGCHKLACVSVGKVGQGWHEQGSRRVQEWVGCGAAVTSYLQICPSGPHQNMLTVAKANTSCV
eukprot:773188-Pelagomonas_calceolata.AAC.3